MQAATPAHPASESLFLTAPDGLRLHVRSYGPRTAPSGSNANKDCGPDRHRGCSATVGLEAPASVLFEAIQCGTGAGPGPGYAPIDDGKVITLTPL